MWLGAKIQPRRGRAPAAITSDGPSCLCSCTQVTCVTPARQPPRTALRCRQRLNQPPSRVGSNGTRTPCRRRGEAHRWVQLFSTHSRRVRGRVGWPRAVRAAAGAGPGRTRPAHARPRFPDAQLAVPEDSVMRCMSEHAAARLLPQDRPPGRTDQVGILCTPPTDAPCRPPGRSPGRALSSAEHARPSYVPPSAHSPQSRSTTVAGGGGRGQALGSHFRASLQDHGPIGRTTGQVHHPPDSPTSVRPVISRPKAAPAQSLAPTATCPSATPISTPTDLDHLRAVRGCRPKAGRPPLDGSTHREGAAPSTRRRPRQMRRRRVSASDTTGKPTHGTRTARRHDS